MCFYLVCQMAVSIGNTRISPKIEGQIRKKMRSQPRELTDCDTIKNKFITMRNSKIDDCSLFICKFG